MTAAGAGTISFLALKSPQNTPEEVSPVADTDTRRVWPWALLALTVLVFGVFHPVLLSDFGTSDDYSNFANVSLGFDPDLDYWVSLGRPLAAWVYREMVERLDHFSDATTIRLAYLVFLTVSAWAVYGVARVAGQPPVASFTVAALATVNPATVDLGSFTTEVGDPLGTLAAACGFYAWFRSTAARLPLTRRAAWMAAAVAGVVLALSFHQIIAFMWIFFLGLTALSPRRFDGARLRHLLGGLVAFAAGVLTYRVLIMGLYLRYVGLEASDRGELTTAPLFKAVWFVLMPLRDALSLFVVFPHDSVLDNKSALLTRELENVLPVAREIASDPAYWLAGLVALCLGVGLWLHFEGSGRWRPVALAAAVTLLPMSYTLNIVIASVWSPFRTQLALASLVGLYAVIAVRELGRRLPRHGSLATAALLLLLVEANAIGIYRLNRNYVVGPLTCEWNDLIREVRDRNGSDLLVVPPPPSSTTAPGVRYELGRQAAAAPWGPKSMVLLARAELGMDPPTRMRILPPVPVEGLTPPPGTSVLKLGCAEAGP